jgi:hypothetical protein
MPQLAAALAPMAGLEVTRALLLVPSAPRLHCALCAVYSQMAVSRSGAARACFSADSLQRLEMPLRQLLC